MGRRAVVVVAVLAMVFAVAPMAFAQGAAVAQLTGTVVDESGGALPGVEVTVTQTDTGMTRFVITGDRGDYLLPGLPVGPYRLEAKLSGFSTYEQTGIVLRVGETRAANVVLKLGALTETLTVTADASLVETSSVGVGSVTPQELIVGLPLNGRQATQLILLEGAAVQQTNADGNVGGGTAGNRGFPGQVAISVAGGTNNSTQYLVDGGYNNDPQMNAGNVIPFPDALQEFRTETGVRDARYGMSVGATVNAITKSGTNLFHGNVFDFIRDHRFNAVRFFEKRENGGLGRSDGLRRQQFGGTLGGPIRTDKLFFFGGVQATLNNVRPLATDVIVPTAEMLRGDFTRIMSAACRGGTARTLGAPFVNNRVDPALFDPLSLKVVSMLPVADPAYDPDGCGRYPLALPNNSTDQQYVSRVDYQMTANKRIFVRDFYAYFQHPPAFNRDKPNLLESTGIGSGNRASQHTIASGLDYIIASNFLSTTRVTYQHTWAVRENGEGLPTLGDLGVNSWMYTAGSKIPGQNILRFQNVVQSGFTGVFYVDTPSVAQDFTWTKGSHNVSFGGQWTRPSSDGDGPFQADGAMIFTGLITSGTNQPSGGIPLADFMLGYPERYRAGGSQINNAYIHAAGVYANDIWQLNRHFTINYGLRWEPFFAPKDRNGFNVAFVRENFDKAIRSAVYPNAPVGLLFKGDPDFPDNNAATYNYYNQLAPRVGVAWDPRGDSVQTIRAGFGVYYDSPKLWFTAHQMLNPPFGQTVDALRPGEAGALLTSCPGKPSRNGCPTDYRNPWNATPGGDPHGNLAHQGEPVRLPGPDTKFPLNGVYTSLPTDIHPMQSYQYNLSYQRQLLERVLLDVTYIGNQQRHIWVSGYAENPAVYIPGNCQAGQYGLTAPGPCSNTTAVNRAARAVLTLLNPKEGAYYNVNTGNQTGVAQAYADGTGSYNGLRLSVQKRLSAGWSANANYTVSKCINQGDPTTDIGVSIPVSLIDPFTDPRPDPKSAEGACSNDRRHLLNLSAVVLSPGVGSGVVNLLTRSWQLGFIFQARSGAPLDPRVTNDNNLRGDNLQRPVLDSALDPYLADPAWVPNAAGLKTQLQWLNPAAFKNAAPGGYGNTVSGSIWGPGFWNADLALSRIVGLSSGRQVEIRVETFNLFDTVNWANPNVTLDSATFGRIINTVGDPRIMQFAVKFGF